ncbi:MAG: hypothetical protein ACT4OX_02340 [Actinomycetota bacterium]
MADNPQQTVRELKELIVTYARQETIDPLKGMRRYVGYGVGGALLIGVGFFFLAIGALRALQTETDTNFTGNLSWVPYALVIVGLVGSAAIAWWARGKRKVQRP